MATIYLRTPLSEEDIAKLKAGDQVYLSGVIYVARDAAHKRLIDLIARGEKLPFDIKNQVIYYMGPSPARPGNVIGSAGPTTSYRMDKFTPALLEQGLKGMIGKGSRNDEVKKSMLANKAVYFAAIGGAAALITKTIEKSEIIAYNDLGAESIRKLEVKDFPAIVINDIYGNDLYIQEREKYSRVVD